MLLDRYVTSNAAYGSARLGGPQVDSGFADWVRELEVDRFGVPVPDRQILLATPLELAAERARDRASSDADRALDSFEADAGLQRRTGAMYRQLARAGLPVAVDRADARTDDGSVTHPGWIWRADPGPVGGRGGPQGLVEMFGADPDVDVQQRDHRPRPGAGQPADQHRDELG